jgi:hypothetical protein
MKDTYTAFPEIFTAVPKIEKIPAPTIAPTPIDVAAYSPIDLMIPVTKTSIYISLPYFINNSGSSRGSLDLEC